MSHQSICRQGPHAVAIDMSSGPQLTSNNSNGVQLRSLAMVLEKMGPFQFNYNRLDDKQTMESKQYPIFCRLYMRFDNIKSIYPSDWNKKKVTCSIGDIMKIETNVSRWVQIPDDS